MDFSDDVLRGLSYLGNVSYISEENFKKIVNSCLGLLSGDSNIERVTTICPEKGDIVKESYAALLTLTIECIRNNFEDDVKNFLIKQNFKSERLEYFLKSFNAARDNIASSLENCSSGWPNIIDTAWKLDFVIKSNIQNQIGEPLCYIVLTTEQDGKIDYIRFTCDLHQLQDLSTKLKEIFLKIECCLLKMTEIWNLKDVTPPAICTVKTILHHKELNKMKDILFDALKTLRNIEYLEKEATFLSRFLYKNKRVFRHDKGMHNLVQIYQCLKKYLDLNLYNILNNFKQSLPAKFLLTATHAFLPTRQMLQWVLLKLQAFSRLFVRIIHLSKKAGMYFYGKIQLGWALKVSLFAFSITARILVISKFLVAKSIEWYNSLYEYLPHFDLTTEFLPNYKFPKNLKKWIGDVDLSSSNRKTSVDKVFELIDLELKNEDDNEVEIIHNSFFKAVLRAAEAQSDSDVEIVSDSEKSYSKKNIVSHPGTLQTEDLGIPIEDDDPEIIKISRKRKKNNNWKKKKKLKNKAINAIGLSSRN